jgi:hypothetical protein
MSPPLADAEAWTVDSPASPRRAGESDIGAGRDGAGTMLERQAYLTENGVAPIIGHPLDDRLPGR